MKVFNSKDLDRWREWFKSLDDKGPYHEPDYLTLLAGGFEQEDEMAEAVVYVGEKGFVYYPYIRRELSELPFSVDDINLNKYSDIVSSWYYGGPIASSEASEETVSEFMENFSEYCKRENIVSEFIRFDPNLANHEKFDDLNPKFNRKTVRVDLKRSIDEIWDDFEKRNRNAIRQALDTDLIVEQSSEKSDLEEFFNIYMNAMDARDASKHYRFPRSFFESLLNTAELATLFVAKHHGDVVGGAITVHDDTVAHDYLRASNPDYWDLRVNNLLCYKMLLNARTAGRELFDFQGGRPGVFKFKRGFSQTGRGEFHIASRIHQRNIYDTLVNAASSKEDINTDSDYFPAYRAELSN